MANIPFFSIIVPVYKVEKYLEDCVESVLVQTCKDYEIILVDDGSPDSCPAICDDFAAQNEQIKVIHKENGGLSDARNVGIKSANGEWIVFLDSDDKLADSNVLWELKDFIKHDDAKIVFCPCLARFSESVSPVFSKYVETEKLTPAQLFEYTQAGGSLFAAWLFVTNSQALKQGKLYFTKGLLHEDMDWIPRLLMATNDLISVFPHNFYLYRFNDESITSRFSQKRFDDVALIINKLRSKNDYEKNTVFCAYWVNMLIYMIFVNLGEIYKEDKLLYDNCKSKLKKILNDNKDILNTQNKIIHVLCTITTIHFAFTIRNILKRFACI